MRAKALPMKKLMLLGALALFAGTIGAQSPAASADQQLENLLREVQAQQVQIADNQAKIDEKLVTLGEAIRVAKIYASRGGR
jgi:DNA-binding sugar fermentation-stimulating protein